MKFSKRPFVTARRLANRLLLEVSKRARLSRVPCKPVNAIFEMCSRCNLRCSLCNTGGLREYFPDVQRGSMELSTFKSGLDVLLPELETVRLFNWGEPLLNREVFDCIAYAHAHDVETILSTNMMPYTAVIGHKLIEASLDLLVVSCDGVTQESYEAYRVGGQLSQVDKGVRDLMDQRGKLGKRTPQVQMQFIVFKHNENEMEAFREYWLNDVGVDAVNFIRMSYMSPLGKRRAEEGDMIPRHPDYQPYHPYGELTKCSELYAHVSLDWNGDWYTCCFPCGDRDFRVGNILCDPFWEVWNGRHYQYCRNLFRGSPNLDHVVETMCHDCAGVYPKGAEKSYWGEPQQSMPESAEG